MAKKKSKIRKSLDASLPIYQLKITLQHIHPPIWRRVQTNDCSLSELHDIIQICMGWEDAHPHAFVIDGEECANLDLGGEAEWDSRFVRLSDLAEQGPTLFFYDYDFGDDWRHIIDIEKTLRGKGGVRYPRCVEGKRACPPEDCGGPYGYPYFLDSLQDPENDEHQEVLEWIGDGFDPEKFDLEKVNRELCILRRWLGRRNTKHALQAAFAKGDLVCVKPGVVHEQYPDIPLSGWVGRVKRIGWLTPIGYAVHWTKPTLDQAHAVYFKRCCRDNEKPYRCWLDEDQLEPASQEAPVAMAQPTQLVTRPLSMDDPGDRIRAVFELTSDDALPRVSQQTLRHFLGHLKAHLAFPFEIKYWFASGSNVGKSFKARVLGFADPPLYRKKGIACEARRGKREFKVALTNLSADEHDPNFQYIEDYRDWFWAAETDSSI